MMIHAGLGWRSGQMTVVDENALAELMAPIYTQAEKDKKATENLAEEDREEICRRIDKAVEIERSANLLKVTYLVPWALGPEWDAERVMEVEGNASSLTIHTPLPKAVLEWLDADITREVIFLTDCNTMNLDFPPQARREDGKHPVQVLFDQVIGMNEYTAPDGTVIQEPIIGTKVVP